MFKVSIDKFGVMPIRNAEVISKSEEINISNVM